MHLTRERVARVFFRSHVDLYIAIQAEDLEVRKGTLTIQFLAENSRSFSIAIDAFSQRFYS